ncbi:MAG: ATPase, T2SS/T4P/T4SS family, partial [Myxococcota bacterium]|nr:ATPase, T2SS/T4P/T4SS family [Myxococcota bacterium]
KAGITFAAALRTILRQDPDVIMVGEIRDPETAQNAIQAALTGHLVLSTLHTNDTGGALTRLAELEVEPFLIASTVVGVMAQRLVRKVCESCRVDTTLSKEQLLALGLPVPDEGDAPQLPVAHGKGCPDCRHTGLRGRIGVFEVMPMSDRLRAMVVDGHPAPEIMKAARTDGMATLRESAIKKLAQGVTSFEEVLRVTVD